MSDQKILIVDDKKENLLALRALLNQEGIEVIESSSGNYALKKLLEVEITLVLLDVQMPDMDGFEVLDIMKNYDRTKDIPVILITAINTDSHYINKGYQKGAVDYINKPINKHVLKNKVDVFLKMEAYKKLLKKKTIMLEEKISELNKLQKKLDEANVKLWEQAHIDGLTKIANKRRFEFKFTKEWNRASRNGSSLSLIMADVDDFKCYNDNFGHLKGDDALKEIAVILDNNAKRPGDLSARYGGEEFVVLLPETDKKGVIEVSKKILKEVKKRNLVIPKNCRGKCLSISLGSCSIIPDQKKYKTRLINKADQALYQAKRNGKNQVIYLPY